MIDDDIYFQEIKDCLKDKHYDKGIVELIWYSFELIKKHYKEYTKVIPENVSYEMIMSNFIDALKDTKEITPVLDINTHDFFLNRIQLTEPVQIPIGYIKDNDGHYIVSKDKPEYYCQAMGVTNCLSKKVDILFDDTTACYESLLAQTILHELAHIRQGLGDLPIPWFVMNRTDYLLCIREGHAMSEARYGCPCTNNFYSIPFSLDDSKKAFILSNSLESKYSLYKYIYFKLETLLGHSYMDEWATTSNNNTYFYQAYKTIDGKYGRDTFLKLYMYISTIILYSSSHDETKLTDMINGQRLLIKENKNDIDFALNDLLMEYESYSLMLNNDRLFNKIYLLGKEAIAEKKDVENIDKEIEAYTEERFREEIIKKRRFIKNEIDIKTDSKFYKMICNANIAICDNVINKENTSHLAETIVSLESLILKCLLKDISKQPKINDEEIRKYMYYISNVEDDTYESKTMTRPNKLLYELKYKSYLKFEGMDYLDKNLDIDEKRK